MNIIDIRPSWGEHHDGSDELRVLVDREPRFDVYEVRQNLYLSHDGPILKYFYWEGKPDHGFGGWRRTVNLSDGTTREVVGGWSSNSTAASLRFPEHLCIPTAFTHEPEVWERGHTFLSGAVELEAVLNWWTANQHRLDWGLYAFAEKTGMSIVPSKGRYLKPGLGGTSHWAARLLPRSLHSMKPEPFTPEECADRRDYFMTAVREAYAKNGGPHSAKLADEQLAAATA